MTENFVHVTEANNTPLVLVGICFCLIVIVLLITLVSLIFDNGFTDTMVSLSAPISLVLTCIIMLLVWFFSVVDSPSIEEAESHYDISISDDKTNVFSGAEFGFLYNGEIHNGKFVSYTEKKDGFVSTEFELMVETDNTFVPFSEISSLE